MSFVYDVTLTPEKLEEALNTLRRVLNGMRPSSRRRDAIEETRSVLMDLHRNITTAQRRREAGKRIAD